MNVPILQDNEVRERLSVRGICDVEHDSAGGKTKKANSSTVNRKGMDHLFELGLPKFK